MSHTQCTFLSASHVGQNSTGQSAYVYRYMCSAATLPQQMRLQSPRAHFRVSCRGMTRKAALTGVSNQICSSVMEAEPRSASAVHHHGSQDTIVYGLQGHGAVLFDRGEKRHNIGPGESVSLESLQSLSSCPRLTVIYSWCLIPAECEHQEVNEGDEKVSCTEPKERERESKALLTAEHRSSGSSIEEVVNHKSITLMAGVRHRRAKAQRQAIVIKHK